MGMRGDYLCQAIALHENHVTKQATKECIPRFLRGESGNTRVGHYEEAGQGEDSSRGWCGCCRGWVTLQAETERGERTSEGEGHDDSDGEFGMRLLLSDSEREKQDEGMNERVSEHPTITVRVRVRAKGEIKCGTG